jgi:hypothetical protein
MDWKPLVDLAAVASAIAAVIGFLLTARQFRRQMNVQLFLEFTQRYGRIIDGFPAEARQARLEASGEPPADSPELRKALLKYLNLSAEEYHLYRNGYIAAPIWEMWEKKMLRALRSPLFVRGWKQLADEFDDQPDFVTYVRAAQAARNA